MGLSVFDATTHRTETTTRSAFHHDEIVSNFTNFFSATSCLERLTKSSWPCPTRKELPNSLRLPTCFFVVQIYPLCKPIDHQARVSTTQPSHLRKAALVPSIPFRAMQPWRTNQMTGLARESPSQRGLVIYTPWKEPFEHFPSLFYYGTRAPTVLPPQFFELSDLERFAVVGYSGLLTVATTTMTYLACRPARTSNENVGVTVACCLLPFALMIAPNHQNKNARRTKNKQKESVQWTGQ
jgi:hypothetical protein